VPICRVLTAALPHILGVGDTIVVATRAHSIFCFSVAGKLEKTCVDASEQHTRTHARTHSTNANVHNVLFAGASNVILT
jgi:hypothetical protein